MARVGSGRVAALVHTLERELCARGLAAEVVLTHNRVRMVSARVRRGAVELRVAHRLLEGGPEVVPALLAWLAGDDDARLRIREEIARLPPAPASPPRRPLLRPHGAHHDLIALERAERERTFPELPPVPITWGRRTAHHAQRTIRLGCYDPRHPLIRIHRRLDDGRVPSWFVGFVIHHELVHHALVLRDGTRAGRLHTPEFRRVEASHPRYEDAKAWERAHLPLLLERSAAGDAGGRRSRAKSV